VVITWLVPILKIPAGTLTNESLDDRRSTYSMRGSCAMLRAPAAQTRINEMLKATFISNLKRRRYMELFVAIGSAERQHSVIKKKDSSG